MISDFIGDGAFISLVGVSILCGIMIGLERQIRGKPSGVRTSILVCIGTAVFVHLGEQVGGPGADPGRVLGQVVTGVGFLGAGVMFMREGTVLGVTTASVIWILAAIGATIGLGKYHMGIGLALTTVTILVVTEWLERTFKGMRRGAHEMYRSPPESRDQDGQEKGKRDR
ncbi:MAG: hypothetical protein AUJ58_08035 [Zetaproteobacteria bacterium CG1_02_55_237]|nr:MAG: hypothetical protein AUJ58_08035 [Zetaproteobacteria bacterium CG1_02_55_237]